MCCNGFECDARRGSGRTRHAVFHPIPSSGRFRQFVTAGRVGLRSSANMASILDLISAVLIVPLCRGVCRPVGVVGAIEVVAMCPAFVGYRYVCLTVTVVIWFTSWPTMLYTTCSVLCHSAWSRRSCPRMGQSGCWSANRLRLIAMAPSVELRGFGRSRWARISVRPRRTSLASSPLRSALLDRRLRFCDEFGRVLQRCERMETVETSSVAWA